jgi:hypothetical protein
MLRYATLLALVAVLGCKKDEGPTVKPLAEENVRDSDATVRVNVGFLPKARNEIDLVIDLVAVGVEQMDKIVVDVDPNGFLILNGSAEWTGFVPPYERRKHKVTLKPRDDETAPSATVTVRRSVDSEVLWQREFPFQVTKAGITP